METTSQTSGLPYRHVLQEQPGNSGQKRESSELVVHLCYALNVYFSVYVSEKKEEKRKQRRYRGVCAISTSGVGKLTSHIRSHCSSALPSAAIFKVVHFINVCLTRNAPKQQIRNCCAALHSTLREFFHPLGN